MPEQFLKHLALNCETRGNQQSLSCYHDFVEYLIQFSRAFLFQFTGMEGAPQPTPSRIGASVPGGAAGAPAGRSNPSPSAEIRDLRRMPLRERLQLRDHPVALALEHARQGVVGQGAHLLKI